MADQCGVGWAEASWIKAAERDRELALDAGRWPSIVPEGWTRRVGRLTRRIKAGKEMAVAIEESILRFPSAPLHGLQRRHEHHVDLGLSENMHTYRVLRSTRPSAQNSRVTRIFLMNTGLNERDRMGLYYKIASHLISQDEPGEQTTVCIVLPFPGHLTRFPFQGFAETPLDRYLWDGSHLFRQFLRHMIETQWFLSVLARRSSYRNATGANLLGESDDKVHSRLETPYLAAEMSMAWRQLRSRSRTALRRAIKDQERAPQVKAGPRQGAFLSSVSSLRRLLHLADDYPGLDGEERLEEVADPAIHVFGYSLGGFTAQSVFMSWPFLISSCCTLLGAGALRGLAPTAFADPEEWQTVLHSLRYELDDRMMSPDVAVRYGRIAGVELELFTFFKRTFYEVFQQDYHGSFQTRLEAFRKRMLFVVGGNDPVVRPKSVIDAAPPGGINLLEMGGVGHFLDGKAESPDEEQQLTFWVPEMTAVLSRFANSAAVDQDRERQYVTFDPDMASPATEKERVDELVNPPKKQKGKKSAHRQGADEEETPRLAPLSAAEMLSIGSDGALPGKTFERCLDDLLGRIDADSPGGTLFMFRNEMPTVLLPDPLIRERAAALYHDDLSIVRYCHGVAMRRKVIEERIANTFLVLPWNARRLMEDMDLQRAFPSQAESAGGHVRNRLTNEEAWTAVRKRCNPLIQSKGHEVLRVFDGHTPLDQLNPDVLEAATTHLGGDMIDQVAALPDCWMWISRDTFGMENRSKLTLTRATKELSRLLGDLNPRDDSRLLRELRSDGIRLVTVSRARYNPRFRGRLIVDPRRARKLLLHATLCLALSEEVAELGFANAFK